ncbi:AEC family transporter [Brytella acorum]|uniref:AEC family transporter n=1 Tax=Brytella acorum TaxID=2959299 RepID=A0AA35XXN9_9PROT|nr:AEC family transporter [Brytella acorum]MDF3626064.1 AEC family transporter [Brytella acorum]CAI9122166.1 AEC family transporter [Brytella acorum]
MSNVISILAPIFGLIAFGALTERADWLGANATDVLNRFVVRLALPAELFQITLQVPLHQLDHPGFASAFGLGMTLTFALGWIMCWCRERAHPQRLSAAAIEGLCASYANTSFIGIPVCLNVFGVQSMAAITLSTLLTTCALFAVAIFMIEADQQRKGRRSVVALTGMRALTRNPLIFAPVVGIALNITGFSLPAPGMTFVTLLAGAASPCALLTIGMFLWKTRQGAMVPLAAVLRLTLMKLLLQPFVTLVLAVKVFSMQPLWAHEALILSALPTGTGPFMLARLYRQDADIASRVTLLTTILSIIIVGVLMGISPMANTSSHT